MRHQLIILLIVLFGCQKVPKSILELQYVLTPTQLSGPALGRELPIYAWRYRLPDESPEAKYYICLELRRNGLEPEKICEFTPEYLSNRSGRDIIVTVTRPGTYGTVSLTDTQFQLRLLDARGEATAIVANNNNCPNDILRALLNFPYRTESGDLASASSSEARLWKIIDNQGKSQGEVFLKATKK